MKIFCNPIHSHIIKIHGIFPLVRLNLWLDAHAHGAAQSYTPKQFEHPQRFENPGLDFDIFQLDINGTDRLVGAVIDTPETGRCFFALAMINNHESDKAFLQDLPHSLEQLREGKALLREIGDIYWLCQNSRGRLLLAKHPELATMITPAALNAIVPDSGDSAAYWLCSTDEGLALLKQYPQLVEMIAPKALNVVTVFGDSGAYHLCATDNGRNLLKQHSKLADMIEPKALNAIWQESAGIHAGTSAAYELCASNNGRELLNQYPELADMISPDALNARLPKSAGSHAGTSAAYKLCASDNGRALIKQYPKLAEMISPDALNARLPKSAGIHDGSSAAYELCASNNGRALLKQYPKLAEMISPEALNKILPKSNNLSATFWLCLNDDGRALLKQYPRLAEMISAEALNERLSKSPHTNLSAAYRLCGSDNGRDLFEEHSGLMDKISADVLNAIIPDSGDSAVFQLCANEKGRALLESNSSFTQKIRVGALNNVLKSPGNNAGKSATFMLCSTESGRAILAKYQWLAKLITYDALNARAKDGTRASLRLCIAPDGRALLAQYPWLAEMIPVDVLKETVPGAPDPRMSVAFLLCAVDNGRDLLKQNPSLTKKINIEDLNTILLEHPGITSGTSAVFKLCASDNGRALLFDNPSLVKRISAGALNSKLLEFADIGNSAVLELCATDNGRKLLLKYPELVEKILPDALNAILLETATANPGTSAAYWLCATDNGRKLLLKHPKLVEMILPDALFEILLKFADTDKTPSMLRCPTQYGQPLLKLLIATLKTQDYQAFQDALKSIQREDILIHLTPKSITPRVSLAKPKNTPSALHQEIQSPLGASPAISEPELPYIEFNWELLKQYIQDANSVSLIRALKSDLYEAKLSTLFSENNVYEIYELLSFKNYQYRYQFTRILSITPYIGGVIKVCIEKDNLELFNQLTLLKPFLESLQKQQTYFLDLCMLQPEQSRRILNACLEDDLLESQYVSAPFDMIKRAIELKIWNVVEKCLPMLDEATLTKEFGFLKAALEANGKLELLPLESTTCQSPPQISALTFSMFQPEQHGFFSWQHLPRPLVDLGLLISSHLQKPFILTGSAVANLFLRRSHHSDYDCIVLGVSLETLKQFLHTHGFCQAKIIGKTYPILKVTINKIEIEITADTCWDKEPIDTFMQGILAKRDFTISALYTDLSTHHKFLEIKGLTGALEKTKKGEISVAGIGPLLFEDDPIRFLRLLKISMQYPDFEPDDTLYVVLSKCDKSDCFNKFLSTGDNQAARISTSLQDLFSRFPKMTVMNCLKESGIFEALTGIPNATLEKNLDILEHYFDEITQEHVVENEFHSYHIKKGFFFFCTALYCLFHDKKSNLGDWPFYGVIQKIKISDRFSLSVIQDFIWNQERDPQYSGTLLYRILEQLEMHKYESTLMPL